MGRHAVYAMPCTKHMSHAWRMAKPAGRSSASRQQALPTFRQHEHVFDLDQALRHLPCTLSAGAVDLVHGRPLRLRNHKIVAQKRGRCLVQLSFSDGNHGAPLIRKARYETLPLAPTVTITVTIAISVP